MAFGPETQLAHVALLAYLFGGLAAVGAIGQSVAVYQRTPRRFIAHFIAFLSLVFVGGLAELVRNYLATNVGISGPMFTATSTLAIAVPTLLGLLYLIRFCEDILKTRLREVVGWFSVLAATQVATVLAVTTDLVPRHFNDTLVPVLQVCLFLLYQYLASRLIWNPFSGDRSRRMALRFAGIWIAAKTLLDILIPVLQVAANLSFEWVSTLQGAVETVSALVIIIFVRRFSRAIVGSSDACNSSGLAKTSMLDEYQISRREREILDLVISGYTNKQIGNRLNISPETVKDHVYSIYKKTGIKNRVQLTNLFRA